MKVQTILVVILLLFTFSCKKYNLSKNGYPKFVSQDFVELSKIKSISKFRSGIGHDYSEKFEHCRSMKHYFNIDSTHGLDSQDSSKIFSPVNGTIRKIFTEGTRDIQLWIESTDYNAFTFRIFHIKTNNTYSKGMSVNKGELLGYSTNTDIAVSINTYRGKRLISYFEIMTDELFATYKERGILNIEELIISEKDRDSSPLECNGEDFLSPYNSEDIIYLK